MRHLISLVCLSALLGGAFLTVIPPLPAGAAPAMRTVAGTLDEVGAGGLTISTASGHTQVVTTADTRVFSRVPARLEDIKPGDFIGVAARKESNGSLTAVSITIFAASLRGRIREGQFPMETGNIMTNAVVTQYVSRTSGRTVTFACKDCTATIAVPNGTDIHRLTVIALGDLRAGMHVTVRGTANGDGSLAASSITVDSPQ